MKEAAPGPPLYFRGRTVDLNYRDNAGNPVSTMTLDRTADIEDVAALDLTDAQKKVVEKLQAMMTRQRETLSEAGFPPENALVLITDLVDQCAEAKIVRLNDPPSKQRRYLRERMLPALADKGAIVLEELHVRLPQVGT